MELNQELKQYIEEKIFPQYRKNEIGHGIEHIQYVIHRSMKFAHTIPSINLDMVFVIAAYHDIGHHIDPKRHEIISAQIMMQDDRLKRFFRRKNCKS